MSDTANAASESSLVRELLAEARAAGAASVILEVRESNRPALRLYESIGFKPEGRRKNYYQDPAEDALLYRILIADLVTKSLEAQMAVC